MSIGEAHWTDSSYFESTNTNGTPMPTGAHSNIALFFSAYKNPRNIIYIMLAHLVWSAFPNGAGVIGALIYWRRSKIYNFSLHCIALFIHLPSYISDSPHLPLYLCLNCTPSPSLSPLPFLSPLHLHLPPKSKGKAQRTIWCTSPTAKDIVLN